MLRPFVLIRSTHLAMLAAGWLLLFSGCTGPMAMRHSRQKWNEAAQVTASEQLLLNLVRLRYRDPPSFMELSGLSTQFAFEKGIFANGGLINGSPSDFLNLGASLSAAERPTITYDLLHGQEFAKQFLSPLDEETIILLVRSGWSIDRVLRMTVQKLAELENARRASGPTPDEISEREYAQFQQLVHGLRSLQKQGKIAIGYDVLDESLSGEIKTDNLSAAAFIDAAREGWRLQPKHERVRVALTKIDGEQNAAKDYLSPDLLEGVLLSIEKRGQRRPIRVRWSTEKEPEKPFVLVDGDYNYIIFKALSQALSEDDEALVECIVEYTDQYVLTKRKQKLLMSWNYKKSTDAERSLLKSAFRLKELDKVKHITLDLEPRSLLGVMYYLANGIHVPPEHEAGHLVTVTVDESGAPFDWALLTGGLLSVHACKTRPESASVAVNYRGYWFYIDDRDLESKSTFSLLRQLFELQAGGGAQVGKPVLTLPVGI